MIGVSIWSFCRMPSLTVNGHRNNRRWWLPIISLLTMAVPLRLLLSYNPETQLMEEWSLRGVEDQGRENTTTQIALYITTHFSEVHIRYFHCCWPILVRDSPLIRRSHIIVAATNATPILQEEMNYLEQLFADNPSYQFWTPLNSNHLSHCEPYKAPQNPKKQFSVSYKQCLANYGIAFGWSRLQQYEWIIRLNPDVLIRQSNWILHSMANTSLDAIIVHCGPNTRQIHTDFWAVRRKAVNATYAFQHMARIGKQLNHERTAFQNFRSILAMKRHMWVPDMEPSKGICRARGQNAPILHEHDSCSYDEICHGLEGWDLTQ